jgi:hypothetical protein
MKFKAIFFHSRRLASLPRHLEGRTSRILEIQVISGLIHFPFKGAPVGDAGFGKCAAPATRRLRRQIPLGNAPVRLMP